MREWRCCWNRTARDCEAGLQHVVSRHCCRYLRAFGHSCGMCVACWVAFKVHVQAIGDRLQIVAPVSYMFSEPGDRGKPVVHTSMVSSPRTAGSRDTRPHMSACFRPLPPVRLPGWCNDEDSTKLQCHSQVDDLSRWCSTIMPDILHPFLLCCATGANTINWHLMDEPSSQ